MALRAIPTKDSEDNEEDTLSQKLLTLGLLLAALAMGLFVLQQRSAPEIAGSVRPSSVPEIRGKQAADFALPDVEGMTVRMADFQDKVLLVNFWATWCQPCLIEIPWFLEFQEQYGPQGFEVIGISLDDEGAEVVKPFMEKHGMTYTVLIGDEEATELFGGILGLPTSFLVDRDGKYYSMHRGLVSRDIIEDELLALLNGAPTE